MAFEAWRIIFLIVYGILLLVVFSWIVRQHPRQRSPKIKKGYEVFIIACGVLATPYLIWRIFVDPFAVGYIFMTALVILGSLVHIISNITGRYA